ncbi:MAG: hypothetical protein A2Y14_04210 [Verrucomicrobia bacterium GWF2_51_19]|nr:MAG: hypothetical protein A2Y14_04210 [Verrucomicrobia bacterium GWF2_51_19]
MWVGLCGVVHAHEIKGSGNILIQGNSNKVEESAAPSKASNAPGESPQAIADEKKELANSADTGHSRLLILTATNYETKKIHKEAEKVGLKIAKEAVRDQVVYNMGTLGGVEVFHMQTGMMGMLEPNATPLALMSVFRDIHPQYVVSTGIAFGNKGKGQTLGDILISRQVANYETRKEKNGEILSRGDKVTSPMLPLVNASIHNWKGAKVHQGLTLSGNALVNSESFLHYLAQREPEYLGGDMEAYGVYSVSSMMGAKWVMIKGISDWGDGTKNDAFHSIALHNAGQFIFHMIQDGNLK